MPTDSAPHLILASASCSGDDWLQAMSSVALKNLGQLLRGMKQVDADAGPALSLSPPHERMLAKAWDLPASADGLIPWAALEAKASLHEGWAFITPCHWAMGREHATLTDSASLDIHEAESRTLLAAMQPYFATEGITLHDAEPTRWLARGEAFRTLPTASLDRVLGRNVDRWLPASKAIKLLQNEMQMLLYTHPVNGDRAAKGQRTVNSFWVSGSGALNGPAAATPQVVTCRALMPAAFANDWAAYAQAWKALDEAAIAHLLTQQKSGKTVRISLCGESQGMTFETAQHSIFSTMRLAFNPQQPMTLLQQLSK
jgi:hypothetical protein